MSVANPNKRRGTRWESEFAKFLNWELGLVTPDGEFLDPTSPLNARRQAQRGDERRGGSVGHPVCGRV